MLLMAMYWVICGSARGVGKTHLSARLVSVLPRAFYAKLGHCPPKPNGRPNYFCSEEALVAFLDAHASIADHFVIESNAWAREGRGNVTIFLQGQNATSPPRDDLIELRRRAHIRLGDDESAEEWERVLVRHLPSRAECQAVLELLVEQTNHLALPVEAALT
jgi:hypothetical protein